MPVARGVIADDDDLLRAAAIQSLMCYDSIDYTAFNAIHNIDFRSYFSEELERFRLMARDGLIEIDDDHIAVAPKGRLLLRNIAMVFDRYLNDDKPKQRYSRAI